MTRLAYRHFEVTSLSFGECEGCIAVAMRNIVDIGDVIEQPLVIEVLDDNARQFYVGQLVTVEIHSGLLHEKEIG